MNEEMEVAWESMLPLPYTYARSVSKVVDHIMKQLREDDFVSPLYIFGVMVELVHDSWLSVHGKQMFCDICENLHTRDVCISYREHNYKVPDDEK